MTSRDAKLHELFDGKKFDVVEEVDSATPLATPLGYKVKKGYRLKSTDGSMDIIVGKALLNTLAEDFDAVTKPEPKKRGRPRKNPVEQEETWAGRDVPNDAQQITQAWPTYANPNADEEFKG